MQPILHVVSTSKKKKKKKDKKDCNHGKRLLQYLSAVNTLDVNDLVRLT